MGVWIEIGRLNAFYNDETEVTPFMGVWIEMLYRETH